MLVNDSDWLARPDPLPFPPPFAPLMASFTVSRPSKLFPPNHLSRSDARAPPHAGRFLQQPATAVPEWRLGLSLDGWSTSRPRLLCGAVEGLDRGSASDGVGGIGVDQIGVPLLSCSEVVRQLKAFRDNKTNRQHYSAMYSSVFGGITTDPAAMVISMDDHMVHRGHGVFDTAAIVDGHLYELDQHIDRFLRSSHMAKISPPFDREKLRNVLIKTVSASKCRKGSLRYWLSAGPGDFLLSPSGCQYSALYAIVIEDPSPFDERGVKVVTSSIPIKSPQFATMKSVNYLPNVLSKMEAEEKGAYAAIWLDDEGYIAEGPNMNVAFLMADKMLVMPFFDKILSGCTARRVISLTEKLVKGGMLREVKLGNISVKEGKMAEEMMLIGSGVLVKPVLQWDESIIGKGKEGPVARALLDLVLEDMKAGPPTVRVPVPY